MEIIFFFTSLILFDYFKIFNYWIRKQVFTDFFYFFKIILFIVNIYIKEFTFNYFEIEVDENDQKNAEKKVDEMCKKLLVNLIIEDYKINKI